MAAFIPDYEFDVFLSYAQVNNESGWTAKFRDGLRLKVDQQLGRSGAARWFFDTFSLQGNRSVPIALDEAITRSAALVVVVSPGYLSSSWCREELKRFVDSAGGIENADRKVFVAYCEDVQRANLPNELANFTGYPFFEVDREYGFPRRIDDDHPEYQRQLARLSWDISKYLLAIRHADVNETQ